MDTCRIVNTHEGGHLMSTSYTQSPQSSRSDATRIWTRADRLMHYVRVKLGTPSRGRTAIVAALAVAVIGAAGLIGPVASRASTVRMTATWTGGSREEGHPGTNPFISVFDEQGNQAYVAAPCPEPLGNPSFTEPCGYDHIAQTTITDPSLSLRTTVFTDLQAPSTRRFYYKFCPSEEAGRPFQVQVVIVDSQGQQRTSDFTLDQAEERCEVLGEVPASVQRSEAHLIAAQAAATLARQSVTEAGHWGIDTLLRRGGFTTSFDAPESGNAVIDWYLVPRGATVAATSAAAKPILVASGSRAFATWGAAPITVRLTGFGNRLLKHRKTIPLTAKSTFTPTGMAPITITSAFVLKTLSPLPGRFCGTLTARAGLAIPEQASVRVTMGSVSCGAARDVVRLALNPETQPVKELGVSKQEPTGVAWTLKDGWTCQSESERFGAGPVACRLGGSGPLRRQHPRDVLLYTVM